MISAQAGVDRFRLYCLYIKHVVFWVCSWLERVISVYEYHRALPSLSFFASIIYCQ